MNDPAPPDGVVRRSFVSVFILSCSIVSLQLALMRSMSVASWHHFAFFVISTALLGYGISGIILLLFGNFLRKKFERSIFWITLAAAIIGNASIWIANQLPLDSQYLLQNRDQLLLFLVFNLLLLIPFLFGAGVIGLCLMQHPAHAGALYGISMVGSALGGILTILMMFFVRETLLPHVALSLIWPAAAIWVRGSPARRISAATAALFLAFILARPPMLALEPYKGLAQMERLAAQGNATKWITSHGPQGRIDVYESPLLHFTLFAGLKAKVAPPPQFSILRDGHFAGTVFRIRSAEEAVILDQTPSSLAYRMRPRAAALLLGEVGGTNVWLARRFQAARITVVQRDQRIPEILNEQLAGASGKVFSGSDISVITEDPRLFLIHTQQQYDLIQLVSAEEMAAESGGAGGLQEDYLLTMDGIKAAWRRLKPSGILSITREIQVPPRDTLKLLAMMHSALTREGVINAGNHVVLLQNYLADCLLLFRSPITADEMVMLESFSKEIALDKIWPSTLATQDRERSTGGNDFPDITDASRAILSPQFDDFIRDWVYDIRPATDDRPYFRDFFRLRSIQWMREVYQDQFFQRMELGFAILLLSWMELSILGILFLLVPVAIWQLRSIRKISNTEQPRLAITLIYFVLIGVGFMAIEITSISRLNLYLGEPVYAATLAITVLLVGAGLGSIVAGRNPEKSLFYIRRAVLLILLFGIPFLTGTYGSVASWTLPSRILICSLFLFPLSFFMGFLFPCGLYLARQSSERFVPWAWAANGFSSVATPPLAMMVAMSAGLRFSFLLSLLCYILAAFTARGFVKRIS